MTSLMDFALGVFVNIAIQQFCLRDRPQRTSVPVNIHRPGFHDKQARVPLRIGKQ